LLCPRALIRSVSPPELVAISGGGASARGGLEAAAAPHNSCCLSATSDTTVCGVDVDEVGKYEWVASDELG